MDQKELAVWQRVRSSDMVPGFSGELLSEAQALTRAYRQLGRPALQRLGEQSEQLLRGVAALEEAPLPPPRHGPEQPRNLRSCFLRCRRLMTEYALRETRQETGPVYRQLEALAREQCIGLAAALGEKHR